MMAPPGACLPNQANHLLDMTDQPTTKLRRYASSRGHTLSLIEEHFEEAATLWSQIQLLRSNASLPWTASEAFEIRYEAHLDALVLSGAHAERMGMERLEEQPELLPVLLQLICRNRNEPLLHQLLTSANLDDESRATCLTALDWDIPSAWIPKVWELACRERIELAEAFFLLGSYRGIDFNPKQIISTYEANHISLVRLFEGIAIGKQKSYLSWLQSPNIWELKGDSFFWGFLALWTHPHFVEQYRLSDNPQKSDSMALRISGLVTPNTYLTECLTHLKSKPLDWNTAFALVHRGHSGTILPLIDKLSDTDSAEMAAWTLSCLTGAEVLENIYVEDPEDDAPTAIQELRQQKGIPAKQGEWIEQPSRNPDRWKSWWQAHASQFVGSQVIRTGLPLDPSTLLAVMKNSKIGHRLHSLCYQEQIFRFGKKSTHFRSPPIALWHRYLNRADL
jgi:hypothetical protein